jgi:hypothetical protein
MRKIAILFPCNVGEVMLTVVIVHFKLSIKHEKGHISTSNIELGFELIEFHRFW